jgi:hypothetical protein
MNDICPHCRVVLDLEVKQKTLRRKNTRGEAIKILVRSYFRSVCGFFVKSEETSVKKKA